MESGSWRLDVLAQPRRGVRSGRTRDPPDAPVTLLAGPGARIYELDEDGATERPYDDVDVVRLTRGFLDAPARYLCAAEPPDDAA